MPSGAAWPGQSQWNRVNTTLDISCGRLGADVVIDTPGVYGLSSFSKEEEIAREIILPVDVVVNVAEAVHLARDLFFTRQIIETVAPVVVALNMLDEAREEGLKTDVPLLAELLGVSVIQTVAVKGIGLEELKKNFLNKIRLYGRMRL